MGCSNTQVEGVTEIKDFRPISMVGSIYRIIAKILAQESHAFFIGETQSAFVMEKQILDGALIANELVRWAKTRKEKIVMLKLDFQKAYDTIHWSFLEHLMELMWFGPKWRKWISQCLSTASISILINGSPIVPL